MKITKVDDIKAGMELWACLPSTDSTEHIRITDGVRQPFNNTIFFDAIDLISGTFTYVFPRDYNIGAHYNENYLFTTEEEARAALKLAGIEEV